MRDEHRRVPERVLGMIEETRALARRGYAVPQWALRMPSARVLELLNEAWNIGGAFRFHQWAASRLKPEVQAHYGDRFVLGAHHLLADMLPSLLAAHNLFDPKPKPSVSLDCSGCQCRTDDERADCLIGRFHEAFEGITSENIAQWYFGLTGLAAKDVRAFIRVAARSDPLFRKTLERILSGELSQQEGLPVKARVRGGKQRPRTTLRDAFVFTTMFALTEWLDPDRMEKDAYAELVTERFGLSSADIIWRRREIRRPAGS